MVLGRSTGDELSVALYCALIAAPIPEIHSLKVHRYAQCDYEKMAVTLLRLYPKTW